VLVAFQSSQVAHEGSDPYRLDQVFPKRITIGDDKPRSVTANVKIPKRAKIKIPTFVRWLHLRHNGLVSQSVEEEATDAGSGGAFHD
jgi:hypothetical protein